MSETEIRLLLVDDDEEILKLLRDLIRIQGYEPDLAKDGIEAINHIKENDYDLVITDNRMPGATGLEVIREAKKKNPDIPVIMFTGYADMDTVIQAMRLGASDFIQKPIRRQLFLNSVNQNIEKKRLIDENIELNESIKQNYNDLEEAMKTIDQQHAIILHNERLKALGFMAASVAHEINNPLGFISTNIQTLEKYIEKLNISDDGHVEDCELFRVFRRETPEIIKGIRNGIKRITHIINGLKTFARRGTEKQENVYISRAVEEALEFCSMFLNDRNVSFSKSGEETPILIVYQHLIQVIINLLQNANDALKKAANPKIEIELRSSPEEQVLSVRDNGTGFKKDVMEHIFEPFFTTKEVGEGVGIGLSLSYGIIKKSGGTIEFESADGSGATFNLRWKTGSGN